MKKYYFILIYFFLMGCNEFPSSKSVTFTVKGIIMDNFSIKNEFGDKYKDANSIVEIHNNTDSIIYIPTDSTHKTLPPCFYSYPNKQGIEESNVHAEISRHGYIDIAPHSSRRFVTRIPFIPISSNPYMRMSLTYAYTTKYQGDSSFWVLIKKQFEHDDKYHFTPSK